MSSFGHKSCPLHVLCLFGRTFDPFTCIPCLAELSNLQLVTDPVVWAARKKGFVAFVRRLRKCMNRRGYEFKFSELGSLVYKCDMKGLAEIDFNDVRWRMAHESLVAGGAGEEVEESVSPEDSASSVPSRVPSKVGSDLDERMDAKLAVFGREIAGTLSGFMAEIRSSLKGGSRVSGRSVSKVGGVRSAGGSEVTVSVVRGAGEPSAASAPVEMQVDGNVLVDGVARLGGATASTLRAGSVTEGRVQGGELRATSVVVKESQAVGSQVAEGLGAEDLTGSVVSSGKVGGGYGGCYEEDAW